MSPATAALVAGFEVAAKAAQQDEDAVRKSMVEEVARLSVGWDSAVSSIISMS
jgi:hypothetical protein